MIKISNLCKSFEAGTILQNVNLEVKKGESVVIIGGSGCGKSTLLRCVDRLIEPDSGEILFEGKNIFDKDFDLNAYRRKVGMVYQQFNLFSHLNVIENLIVTPVKVLGMDQNEAIEKAKVILKKVGMENSINKMPSALSGGQKQRVSIARTLMMDPEVILFDEPTSALDPTMVDEVENVIRNLINDGLTCIIVTHEMRFARLISSKVVFLAEKGVYEEGTPEEIFDHPDKPLTREFIFRSRLFSQECRKEDFDLYSCASAIKSFIMPYGLTGKQRYVIEMAIEEIVSRHVEAGRKVIVNAAASDSGVGHKLFIECPEYGGELLKYEGIDELGMKILEKDCLVIKDNLNEYGTYGTYIEF